MRQPNKYQLRHRHQDYEEVDLVRVMPERPKYDD
jgi:hypothetical protein